MKTCIAYVMKSMTTLMRRETFQSATFGSAEGEGVENVSPFL